MKDYKILRYCLFKLIKTSALANKHNEIKDEQGMAKLQIVEDRYKKLE